MGTNKLHVLLVQLVQQLVLPQLDYQLLAEVVILLERMELVVDVLLELGQVQEAKEPVQLVPRLSLRVILFPVKQLVGT